MSDSAVSQAAQPHAPGQSVTRAPQPRIASELKVSGHLMNLEAGLFCIVHTPSRAADPRTGLPGVRISPAPTAPEGGASVSIRTFREDGWLSGTGDAALVRVSGGSAQILVTVYQAAGTADGAPNLQVLRLIDPPVPGGGAGAAPIAAPPVLAAPVPALPAASGPPEVMDMLAHIQGMGDVGGRLGEWLGTRGSRRWIEGFAIAPTRDVAAADIEYQAVLGRGWLSPWVEGGQFCGSRGMALPVLGVRIRLRGDAAARFEVVYTCGFADGSEVGPVSDGAPCETDLLAAVEALTVSLVPKNASAETPPSLTESAD